MEALAWPAVVLLLGFTFLLVFRKPISNLIEHTKKIGKLGIEVGHMPQDFAVISKISPAERLLEMFDNMLILKMEETIKGELEEAAIRESHDRERVLVRYLAASLIVQKFEKVYSEILGSQLEILQNLNMVGDVGLDIDTVKSWYEQAEVSNPNVFKNYSFNRWLGFLESWSLIKRNGEDVSITLDGREFLKYLIDQGYSFYKKN